VRSERRWLAGIFLLSLALNLGYVLGMERWLAVDSDALGYDTNGWKLAQGQGFPTDGLQPRREPGIYVFLGSIYFIFGHDYRTVRVIQAVMSASLCLLTFAMASRLARAGALPSSAPIVAAVLTTLYVPFIFYSGVLMREAVITFLSLVSLVFLTGYVITGRWRQAAGYGAFAGLAALVDGRFLFFIPFLTVLFLVTRRGVRQSLAFAVVAGGVALLLISPWTIRNYVVLHKFVLLATAQYRGLWLATNPEGIDDWDWTREPLKSLHDLPRDQRDQAIAELAVRNLREHPVRWAVSGVGRFFKLWWGGSGSNVMPLLTRSLRSALTSRDWGYAAVKLGLLAVSYGYVFGGFFSAGWIVRRAGIAPVVHMVGFLAYLSIIHMITNSAPRYHIPAVPVLIVFLSGSLGYAWERLPKRTPL
jgi:dolichyl-phosphate-mannose-protein mannosyltransferase